jgi:hypothetical protein
MRKFIVVVAVLFFASGCGGGGGGQLSEAGLALRAALTAQTFGDFKSGSDVIASNSPAYHKFTAIENNYALHFQTGNVSKKKNVSGKNDSFLYCSVSGSSSECSDNYFEVNNIVESAGQITDFNWSRGSSKDDLVAVGLGVTRNMQWGTLDSDGVGAIDGFTLEVKSAVEDGGQTCFAIEFETIWDDAEFRGKVVVMAWTTDGILVDAGGSTPITDRINRGRPQLKKLCFDYPIDQLESIEFGEAALTFDDNLGRFRTTVAHSMPVSFSKLYVSDR